MKTDPSAADGVHRDEQIRFYRERVDAESEISRPRGFPRAVRFLLDLKLARVLSLLGIPRLEAKRAAVVCAGSGLDSEFLARRGMRVVATDLSFEAIERARERGRRYGVSYDLAVADAEYLPFVDRAFDIVLVHDGLHHLFDPTRAVREMMRVSRDGVVIAEPARSPLTGLAVWVGLAGEWEDAGNYVHRFSAKALGQLFASGGFPVQRSRQDLIYYQRWTFPLYRLLDRDLGFALFRAAFWLVNRLVGRWGNSLKFAARRQGAANDS